MGTYVDLNYAFQILEVGDIKKKKKKEKKSFKHLVGKKRTEALLVLEKSNTQNLVCLNACLQGIQSTITSILNLI